MVFGIVNVTFLFWNLRGNHRQTLEARTPRLLTALERFAESVDVFLFAECTIAPARIVAAIRATNDAFYEVPAQSRRIAMFSKLAGASWSERYYDAVSDRITVQEVQIGRAPAILVIGAHLDAAPLSREGRAEWARDLARDIRMVETDAGHARTVLVGDLNMNPFDGGLIETSALHAVMTKRLAAWVQRLSARKGYLPFYNPMWSFFGDWGSTAGVNIRSTSRMPGTYFFRDTNDRASHFWHVYDQLLLRPALMEQLVRLEVLGTDGTESLTTNSGRPRSGFFSDHLPILFTMDVR